MKTLRMMTAEELVVLYAEGNNAAFDVLLNRYKSSIHSYIYFIVHNKDLTEDIFQETFVKVIMTIKQGRYTENGKFKAWITRIAHNLIIDNFRQERSEIRFQMMKWKWIYSIISNFATARSKITSYAVRYCLM